MIDDKSFKNLLKEIKKEFPLTKAAKPNLRYFGILRAGKFFRISYAWHLSENPNILIVSIFNSYGFHTAGSTGGRYNEEPYKTIVALVKYNYSIKDSHIRLKDSEDKIYNLFFRNPLKIPDNKDFNKMYVIHSNEQLKFINWLIMNDLPNKALGMEGLEIEFQEDTILLKLQKPVTEKEQLKSLITVATGIK